MRYKLIITGAVGSGKTTAVNALSDKKALLTDAPASDLATSQRKETTTVALDYGVVKLNEEDVAHVYGTPGQERFDFMWEILSEGAHGLILLIDNSRNYPFRDLKYYSEQFSELIKETRLIIGVTFFDVNQEPDIKTYQQWLKELKLDADVVAIDARNKDDVSKLVMQLLDDKVLEQVQGNVASVADVVKEEKEEDDNSHEEYDSAEIVDIPSLEKMNLTRNSMQAVEKIPGVIGVSLTNDMGELLDSSIDDEALNELIAFISGITPSLEETADLGSIHRIMLRGPRDDNLTVFVENERSLGVFSERKASVPALSQQIEDMLQWI